MDVVDDDDVGDCGCVVLVGDPVVVFVVVVPRDGNCGNCGSGGTMDGGEPPDDVDDDDGGVLISGDCCCDCGRGGGSGGVVVLVSLESLGGDDMCCLCVCAFLFRWWMVGWMEFRLMMIRNLQLCSSFSLSLGKCVCK